MSSAFDDETRIGRDGRLHVRAAAKVNLGLRVVGRRDDGYHLLESLFVPIDWWDDLAIGWRPGRGRHVSLRVERSEVDAVGSSQSIPSGSDNLVHRAATRFLAAAERDGAVDLELTKRLPAGAGLGGGSSDAGAVLRGLAHRLPGAVPAARLAGIALELGADVPFFLAPRPCWVGGIGERLAPLAAMPELHLVLANPGVALPTPEVFRAFDASGSTIAAEAQGEVRSALAAWLRAQARGPAAAADPLARLLRNDLEPAARELVPGIGHLLARLRALGARACSLSGSGATVFGVFSGAEDARTAAAKLDAEGPGWVRVARTQAV